MVLKIADAVANPDDYNLAEFLDFDTAEIILDAINFCRKKRIDLTGVYKL